MACPKEIVDTMYPLVLNALQKINNGKGAKLKDIICFIKKYDNPALSDGEVNCSVKAALKKGRCLKAIKKSLLGKYKLKFPCHPKKRCFPTSKKSPSPRCPPAKPSTKKSGFKKSKCPNPKCKK